jgi:hypothetical protein
MNQSLTFDPNSPVASALPTVIARYFESFNAEDFELTASLFAEDGALHPPFDAAIVGRKEIASYLEIEAKSMKLQPLHCSATTLEDSNSEYTVVGRAETSIFSVNISWLFVVNPNLEIVVTRVKLLASLAELVNFKKE